MQRSVAGVEKLAPTPLAQVEVGLVRGDRDLEQVLDLQRRNLAFTQDGFVTVRHTMDVLRAFHEVLPSVVARHRDVVIAYALSMPRQAGALVPVLVPMFQRLEALAALAGQRWYVMGQVCVAQDWRGSGLFDRLYGAHRQHHAGQFDWLVTEIAMRNPRSRRAHARTGFVEIDRYQDATDDWSVVGLRLSPAGTPDVPPRCPPPPAR